MLHDGYSAKEVKAIPYPSTDSNGFSLKSSALRTEATSVNSIVTDTKCFGSSDGKISYTISGGIPPYTYNWSSGESGSIYGSCWNIIEIINPGSTTVTNYQVLITLPFYTGMNSDFSDVLFSDTNNTVSYHYWRESFQSNTTANFWVKIPSLPSGSSFLRVSYCDATASTQSDGPSTFEYFDSFDDQNISDWTHVCQDVDYPDETCTIGTTSVSGSDYAAVLHSYAHCVGTPVTGVLNNMNKTFALPAGQYWVDFSSKFLTCLRTICSDSSRTYSYLYINGTFFSAFYLEKRTTCGCAVSTWNQIRANGPITSTGIPINYDLRTEVTDCSEGELQYDNFRLRKWYFDPIVNIGAPKQLELDSLLAGDYMITVTDGSGTKVTRTITVHQPDPPIVTNNALCSKQPSVLLASGAYNSFLWYAAPSGGSALQSGATLTTDTLTRDTTFYVTGIGTNGCESSPRTPSKTTILLPSSSNQCITVYSGISPNGDGLNDTWEIKGIEGYPDNHVTIFDRWGIVIFEKKHYDNLVQNTWKGKSNKGTSNDQDLPDGTYYYEIDINGLSKPLSGYVIINREQ